MVKLVAAAIGLGFATSALLIYITAVWLNWYWWHSTNLLVYFIERYIEGPALLLGWGTTLWLSIDSLVRFGHANSR